jgi:hypothetical protein
VLRAHRLERVVAQHGFDGVEWQTGGGGGGGAAAGPCAGGRGAAPAGAGGLEPPW